MKLALTAVFVKDMEKSRAFYSGILGLKEHMDSGVHLSYNCGLSLWQEDAALGTIHSEKVPAGGGSRFELCFESEDLKADFARVKSGGARVISPVAEQPWGQRVFRVYDPDGHIVEVAEPLTMTVKRFISAGLSVREIADKTTIPAEIVEQMAK
ncbi:glyoxalase [Geovibrio thiophilus]|uniref:Glyoxalase n=1 Tax=Geovibrio thiophilus TaxID=139438 RepID=A0A410JWM5_9BACT|nr:VOC family protein [Geovibrio thiophilus]QAR32431.1 glyoxalase [Geovibrio thiophilus]